MIISPSATEVHVWHGRNPPTGAPEADPAPADLAVLPAAQRARCGQINRSEERARFARTRAAAYRLLAGYLGTAPSVLRLSYGPCCQCGSERHGPPRIERPVTDLTFSFSSSGDDWLLAVARDHQVGVDIEQVGVDIEAVGGADVGLLAETCLTMGERRYVMAGNEPDRQAAFARCWTRKEAVLKACGVGLAVPLRSVPVMPESPGGSYVKLNCPNGFRLWAVRDLGLGREDNEPGGHGLAACWAGALAQPSAVAPASITLREAGEAGA